MLKKEHDYYPVIKTAAENCGWMYHRIETKDKRGFPDIILLQGDLYWLVEVKYLHKKSLVTVEDDLTWQFGQIAFMKDCLRRGIRYMLAVVKEQETLLLTGEASYGYIDHSHLAEQLRLL